VVSASQNGFQLGGVLNETGGGESVSVGSSPLDSEGLTSLEIGGTYNLGGGALTAAYTQVLGGIFNATGGNATLGGLTVVFGGRVVQTAGQLTVGTLGPYGGCNVGSSYSLQGGTLSCTALNISASNPPTIGTFSYKGGTLVTGTLTISGSAQMVIPEGARRVLRVSSVNIGTVSGGGFDGGIDLADNGMIVDYTGTSPLPTIANLIQKGTYNGNAQSASGIVSSTSIINGASGHPTTIAYAEASALGLGTFDGQAVDSTCVVVRYTFVGDANLDGIVNGLDFNALANNYGRSGKTLTQGDFTGDGIVNSSDFAALAMNYGQSTPSATAASVPSALPLGAVVPEPVMLGNILIAAGLMRRRRHRAEPIAK
jgi:hypothetical protein